MIEVAVGFYAVSEISTLYHSQRMVNLNLGANRRSAMRSGIALRDGFDGEGLWRLARRTEDAAQARRLFPLPSIYDGGSRSDAASLGTVTLHIVQDWVMRFNERGPQGRTNGKAPGHHSRLNDLQRTALAQAIERRPAPYLDGLVRWRLCDLAQWFWEESLVSLSEQTLGREVRAMRYRRLAAPPRHYAQDSQAIEDFKKVSPPQWQRLPPERPEVNGREIWFEDEARIVSGVSLTHLTSAEGRSENYGCDIDGKNAQRAVMAVTHAFAKPHRLLFRTLAPVDQKHPNFLVRNSSQWAINIVRLTIRRCCAAKAL